MANDTCGCGHPRDSHDNHGCTEWRRYPEVLHARQCGCLRYRAQFEH